MLRSKAAPQPCARQSWQVPHHKSLVNQFITLIPLTSAGSPSPGFGSVRSPYTQHNLPNYMWPCLPLAHVSRSALNGGVDNFSAFAWDTSTEAGNIMHLCKIQRRWTEFLGNHCPWHLVEDPSYISFMLPSQFGMPFLPCYLPHQTYSSLKIRMNHIFYKTFPKFPYSHRLY